MFRKMGMSNIGFQIANLIVLNIAEYDTCFTRLTDISRYFIPENRTEE